MSTIITILIIAIIAALVIVGLKEKELFLSIQRARAPAVAVEP